MFNLHPAAGVPRAGATLSSLLVLLVLQASPSAAGDADDSASARLAVHPHDNTHVEHDHGDKKVSEVHLTPEQRRTLELEITALEPRVIAETLSAPGEVRLNAYATAQVTPRVAAQVVARHARLGEQVASGQAAGDPVQR